MSRGAVWAWKVRRGGWRLVEEQVVSFRVLLGVPMANWEPVWPVKEGIEEGSQAAKQVG